MSPAENTFGSEVLYSAVVARDVAARVEIDAERLQQPLMHGMNEAHRQQHEIGVQHEFGAGQRLELVVDLDAMQLRNLAVVAGKLLGQNREFAFGPFRLA